VSFLTPLFLVGLAALAVPVLLHLIQRERKNVVEFPSLMFLRRIPYESVRRRRIRNWALLMLRLAALALIVLAFARPFLRRAQSPGGGAGGAREVVVLIDRSYSMGYADRWQRAMAAAREAIGKIGSGDRGSIVFFSSNAEVVLRSTSDRGRLESALSSARPSAGATKFAPALKLAGSILSESALPRREVVLITDLQRGGWQGAEGVRLPDGAVVTAVPIVDKDSANVAVTPVSLQRANFSGQERVTVTSGVINRSSRQAAVDMTLELDGRGVQTRRVSAEANGSGSVSFEPVTIGAPSTRAAVRITADALERDNVFDFVLSPSRPVNVLVLDRAGAQPGSSLYLARALAVGDAPRFDATVKSVDAITAADLDTATVVVSNDAVIPPATADRLARFVERGGGLLLAAGERASWPSNGPDVLPAGLGAPVDRTRGNAARLGALEYSHPVFEIFRAPRSGDFSAARFYGYRALTPAAGAQVIARFDDGSAAAIERRVGNGRVIAWASTLDVSWNDLAVKPVFLPFVHKLMTHLGSYTDSPAWLTIGDVLDPLRAGLAVQRGRSGTALPMVLSPSGQRMLLDGEGPDVIELDEQGFYEVRGQARGGDGGVAVASNVDLAESDLTPMDAQELVAAAEGHAGGARAAGADPAATAEAQERAQKVWWYLLFAGILLLGAETILANGIALRSGDRRVRL
jgi:uncharacterized membrane protein